MYLLAPVQTVPSSASCGLGEKKVTRTSNVNTGTTNRVPISFYLFTCVHILNIPKTKENIFTIDALQFTMHSVEINHSCMAHNGT